MDNEAFLKVYIYDKLIEYSCYTFFFLIIFVILGISNINKFLCTRPSQYIGINIFCTVFFFNFC